MYISEDRRNIKQKGNDGKSKKGRDYCKICKSYDLYNNTVDEEGFHDENGRYVTICQTCGTIQEDV